MESMHVSLLSGENCRPLRRHEAPYRMRALRCCAINLPRVLTNAPLSQPVVARGPLLNSRYLM